MKCTCDEIGESPCQNHGFGLLECDCGMRFTAPLYVKSFMLIQCPACGQSYAGYEDCCNGMWKKVTEIERAHSSAVLQVEARIVAWLRVTPRADGVGLNIGSSQDIARIADAIEHGEHRGEYVLRDHK